MVSLESLIDAIIQADEASVAHLIQLSRDLTINILNLCDSDGLTPLMHSAASNEAQLLVPYLIYEGADIHAQDHYGRTALHYFAAQGRSYGLTCLLHHGAVVDAVSKDCEATPYDYSLRYHQHEAMKILLAFGAKIPSSSASNDEDASVQRTSPTSSRQNSTSSHMAGH
jgi:ankyrin repeat protein